MLGGRTFYQLMIDRSPFHLRLAGQKAKWQSRKIAVSPQCGDCGGLRRLLLLPCANNTIPVGCGGRPKSPCRLTFAGPTETTWAREAGFVAQPGVMGPLLFGRWDVSQRFPMHARHSGEATRIPLRQIPVKSPRKIAQYRKRIREYAER